MILVAPLSYDETKAFRGQFAWGHTVTEWRDSYPRSLAPESFQGFVLTYRASQGQEQGHHISVSQVKYTFPCSKHCILWFDWL